MDQRVAASASAVRDSGLAGPSVPFWGVRACEYLCRCELGNRRRSLEAVPALASQPIESGGLGVEAHDGDAIGRFGAQAGPCSADGADPQRGQSVEAGNEPLDIAGERPGILRPAGDVFRRRDKYIVALPPEVEGVVRCRHHGAPNRQGMFDADYRRRAPVRLESELFHAADDGHLVRPCPGRVDHNAGLEGLLASADLPAAAKPLRRMQPGAGDDVHARSFGPCPVVVKQDRRVAAERSRVQACSGE